MTFTQVTARLKNFLVGWLLVLGLKEGLVECATVCLKSWVILMFVLAMLTPTLCAFPINAISLIALNTAVFRFGKN